MEKAEEGFLLQQSWLEQGQHSKGHRRYAADRDEDVAGDEEQQVEDYHSYNKQMLRNQRLSLPETLLLSKEMLPYEKKPFDLGKKDILMNGRHRMDKLDSIIKSKVHYNTSLKFLKGSWSKSQSKRSSTPETPSKTQQTSEQLTFSLKVHKLQHYMRTTMMIFGQMFTHTKNKKEILKRLHGWEDEFESFFFEDSCLTVKRINKAEMASRFGFEKKTSKSTSYFNKLKLLVEQVNRTNEERYNLLSQIQMSKISQKLQSIETINQQFKRSYHGKDKGKYENMARGTISNISAIKSKMWNTSKSVKYIEDLTGPIDINHFLRRQENKICYVENIFLKGDKN